MAKNGNIHPKRVFKKPEDLLEAWSEYKVWINEQAKNWPKIQYVGKEGERKEDYPKMPYTLEGFKRYCRIHHGEVQNYFDNTEGYYEDFYAICSRVREEIREDQLTGGLLGMYNPSITQRLNNLKEQSEVTNTNISILNIDPLDDSANDITT